MAKSDVMEIRSRLNNKCDMIFTQCIGFYFKRDVYTLRFTFVKEYTDFNGEN